MLVKSDMNKTNRRYEPASIASRSIPLRDSGRFVRFASHFFISANASVTPPPLTASRGKQADSNPHFQRTDLALDFQKRRNLIQYPLLTFCFHALDKRPVAFHYIAETII